MEDTSNLEDFLAIASYIGRFPYGNFRKNFWRFYVYCWCSFSILLEIAGVIFEILQRDQYFFYILPIMVYVQWLFLNLQCSQNAINQVEKWKKILSAFSKYNQISPNIFKRSQMNRYIFIFAIVAVNMSFLHDSSKYNDLFNFTVVFRLTLKINWAFHMNVIVMIYAVILENLSLLNNRYKDIKKEVSTWHRRLMVPKDRLGNVICRYRILYDISTNLDEIFGRIMLMLIANTFLITIDLIGIVLTVQLEYATVVLVKFICYGIMLVAAAICTLSYYDSTEKIGKEIVKSCYIYEASNGFFTSSLVKYFDKLSPKFTADGYFSLNKRVLPSLLAGTATYVVVMLQLKPN